MDKRVFCIGNGESRKNFNLEKLKPNEVKTLNSVCKEKHLDLKKNNIKGIF